MSDLAAALMVAIRAHAAQCDKQGQPYLLHVLRVVEAVSDEAKPLAALHDVLEDAPEYGHTPELLALVRRTGADYGALFQLTRRADQTYATYIADIAARQHESPSRLAREVKIADLRDNLGRIPADNDLPFGEQKTRWASLRARYTKALATLEAATPHPAHERARADQEED